MRLLLIQDSPERAQLIVEHLRRSGSDAECTRVSTAAEMRRALDAEIPYDAVVCDPAVAEMGVAAVLEAVGGANGVSPIFVVLDADGAQNGGAPEPLGRDPNSESTLDVHASSVRGLIDAAPDAMLVVDFGTGLQIFNRRFAEMWNVEEGAPRTTLNALFPPALRIVVELLDLDAVSESSGTLELTDGRAVEWFSAPQRVDRRAAGRVWTLRDITTLSAAQKALERSEWKYRSLVSNIPDVLWSADALGHITFVSPNVLALDGYTPEQICGGGDAAWLDRVHPGDREDVANAYTDLFVRELAFDVEYRIRHKDGRWIWVHDRALSTYEIGGLRYADGVISDISARKREEEERKLLSEERELLLESAAEGIYGIDREGRTTFLNRAAVDILGYTSDELLGRPIHELIHHHRGDGEPYAAHHCPIDGAFKRGELRRVVNDVFDKKDGSSISVEYVAAPMIASGEIRGAVVLFSDTSERRSLERSLEQANRIASLGRVAATIAHEFNNVLMGIQPFSEVIRRIAGENEKLISAADHIGRAVQRGKGVAQEILRFTRPASPILKPVELKGALAHLAGELRASLPGTCALDLRVPENAVEIDADWPQLEQVIANLVVNARDAMNGVGTITLSVVEDLPEAMWRAGMDPDEFVHLACIDSGPGMTPEVMERVFEPLFTTKRSGTGLGLAVAHQVVARHCGQILVESEVGHGTTFHLLLRRSRKDGAGPSLPTTDSVGAALQAAPSSRG